MILGHIRVRDEDCVALELAVTQHQADGLSIMRTLIANASTLMWMIKLLALANDQARPLRVTLAARALTARSPEDIAALNQLVGQIAEALPAHDQPDLIANARNAVTNLAILALATKSP
jgi:hypothetical protein